ncbi:MAG: AAA family ATPase, partial [Jatrophihabitantaceae bacterium]
MLLERADALEMLRAGFERVRASGCGEVMTVSGEAGIGKTSLVRAFAPALGGDVYFGACDPLQNPRPLGPLRDIAAATDSAEAAILRANLDHPDSRTELFAATLALLSGRNSAVAWVVEDAHWADEATLDLLTFLGRRVASVPALLVLTFRDDEVGRTHPLRAALGELRLASNNRIRLERLSSAAVAALVGPRPVDAGQLYELTAGNPFFVQQCIDEWPSAGTFDVPASVTDAVLARAARLGPAAQALISACSVHPGTLTRRLLVELATELGAADECVEAGLLVEAPQGLAFRHELARRAITDSLLPDERRNAHLRVLDSLASAPDTDISWLAFHAELAEMAGRVIEFAPIAAARDTELGALRSALDHLRAAVRHAELLPVADAAALHYRHGLAATATGVFAEAIEAFTRAAGLWHEGGDPAREASARAALSRPLVNTGRQREATESVTLAIALLEPFGPSPGLAQAYTYRTQHHMLSREFGEAERWAQRTRDLAVTLERDDLLAEVHIQGGVARLMSGDERGLTDLNNGIDLARRLGLHELVATGYSQLGSGAGEIRRHDLALPALRTGIAWAEQHQLSNDYALAWLARCLLDLG